MLIHIIRFELSGQQENGIGTGLGGSHPPFRKGRGKGWGIPMRSEECWASPRSSRSVAEDVGCSWLRECNADVAN